MNKLDIKYALRKFLYIYVCYLIVESRIFFLRMIFEMNLGKAARISLKANLDRASPKGIHIGDYTYIAFDAVILTHDMARLIHKDMKIGKKCFIGAHSVILPGVTIGDECIVAAGSIVTKDIPSNSMVAGNPARLIKNDINTDNYGIMK